MEHVPVDSGEHLDALALQPTDSPEFHGVGVVGLERDLDEVHFLAPANLKTEAVFGLRECVGAEHKERWLAQLLDDGLCYITHKPMAQCRLTCCGRNSGLRECFRW